MPSYSRLSAAISLDSARSLELGELGTSFGSCRTPLMHQLWALLHTDLDSARALEVAELIETEPIRHQTLVYVGTHDLFGSDTLRARALVAEAIGQLGVRATYSFITNELAILARKAGVMDQIISWALARTGDERIYAAAAALRGARGAQGMPGFAGHPDQLRL